MGIEDFRLAALPLDSIQAFATLTMVGPIGVMILIDGLFRRIFVLLRQFQVFYYKRSHGVCGHNIFLDEFHLNNTISFDAIFWPIHLCMERK